LLFSLIKHQILTLIIIFFLQGTGRRPGDRLGGLSLWQVAAAAVCQQQRIKFLFMHFFSYGFPYVVVLDRKWGYDQVFF
jgi:hypothetical protein